MFWILLILAILLLFISVFTFQNQNFFILFLSGLLFLLTGAGLLTQAITIENTTQEIYTYNYSHTPPLLQKIETQKIPYTNSYRRVLDGTLIFLGIFLCITSILDFKGGSNQ